MKNLYKELFYMQKDLKLTDKVMVRRITVTITVIVACLIAMSFSAYAYFSYNTVAATNVIKAAHFETMVSLHVTDEYGQAVINDPTTSNYQSYAIPLEAWERYKVTVTPTENCTASTGFVAITADGCLETYHTYQVWKDENVAEGKLKTISFELMVTADTNVYFVANWGTSSCYDAFVNREENSEYYVTQGELIRMVVNGDQKQQYIVKHGDILSTIADTVNTTVERIAAYNGIVDANNITEGQILLIPPSTWIMPSQPQTDPIVEEQTPPTQEQTTPETEPIVEEQTPPTQEQTIPETEPTVEEQTPPTTEETPPVTDEASVVTE